MEDGQEDLFETDMGSDESGEDESDGEDRYATETKNGLDELLRGDMTTKLRTWVLRNITSLHQKVIDELLIVIRSEGYDNVPKSSKTLLKTNSNTDEIQLMLSKKRTYGKFSYLGIRTNLDEIIDPTECTEKEIELLVGADGAKVYNKTKNDMWFTMGLVRHKNYESKPFIISMFYGDSKPFSARNYFSDCVDELNQLGAEGITIKGVHYTFHFKAFVGDTPARAFLKMCKGHTGFSCCERCEVVGKSVTIETKSGKKSYKRVFDDVYCKKRTNESFRAQTDPEHHLRRETSPFVDIHNFDPVRHVVLDAMHLLCCGNSKLFLQRLIKENRNGTRGPTNQYVLQTALDLISNDIVLEFQRKKFDLDDISSMKSTQFRFILLYCSGMIYKQVLSPDKFRHFLLLFTAARILSSEELASVHYQYANELLRKFVRLAPTFYDDKIVSIVVHNLIHISDDVEYMKAPVFDFSAFAFENCIGFCKKLVKSRLNPVAQILRRIHEVRQSSTSIKERFPLLYSLQKLDSIPIVKLDKKCSDNEIIFSHVKITNMTLRPSNPDNVVILKNGEIVLINKIFARNTKADVQFRGQMIVADIDVFDYPMPSKEVGITQVREISAENNVYNVKDICKKCMLTTIDEQQIVIQLLHL